MSGIDPRSQLWVPGRARGHESASPDGLWVPDKVPWAMPSQVVASTSLYSAPAWPLSCTSLFSGHFWPVIQRIWVYYPADESGANASNYTRITFKVGSFASPLTLSTLETYSGYTAGTLIEESSYYAMKPSEAIFVSFNRIGSAKNYASNTLPVCFGVELFGERIA